VTDVFSNRTSVLFRAAVPYCFGLLSPHQHSRRVQKLLCQENQSTRTDVKWRSGLLLSISSLMANFSLSC
jgi:hypothetical protein